MEDDWQAETPTAFRRLATLLADIAGAILFIMMMLTIIDIVDRSLGFGSVEPVVELTTMGVVLVAACALAMTTIHGGHVIIDLFTAKNQRSTNRRIDAFWLLVISVFQVGIAFLSIREGLILHSYDTTTEVLEWSVLAYYLPPSLGWIFAGITAAWIGFSVYLRRRD